ncbi:rCG20826 [Rattus norvegicus]|uniref:RCG20826 n=1 Tax=Rattus norvegicus TaxID=10116 RepID=A6JED4_RAT|nr:rCG20826 [Rattus norvegicus]
MVFINATLKPMCIILMEFLNSMSETAEFSSIARIEELPGHS